MSALEAVEIKAFIPAKDYAISKQFYQDMGFTLASDTEGVAYFHYGNCSFLLQDFYEKDHVENFMMHLLVKDVVAWHAHLIAQDMVSKYQIHISDIETQPWKMLDFTVTDPGGVLWRIGQNIA
ncbi:VOC family protein [Janthinobacterium sp. B9-8]|uniref:VOC family protein n=1 Tax=Janthinobacterium sp. B9-8 TaxID=1236179 RepID=UPI00061D2237|nr:VOC family protein [Janthinobacterium sp. B9-8]AMC33447.1 glyoxalase [Janthinobacterium sp. B9-8]